MVMVEELILSFAAAPYKHVGDVMETVSIIISSMGWAKDQSSTGALDWSVQW